MKQWEKQCPNCGIVTHMMLHHFCGEKLANSLGGYTEEEMEKRFGLATKNDPGEITWIKLKENQ